MNFFTFGKGKQPELKAQFKGNQQNSPGNIEYIELVEKCQQIIRDDKNILRQLIKEGNAQVLSIIKTKKKFLDQMQTELKKYLKTMKTQQQRSDGDQPLTQRQQNQNDSYINIGVNEKPLSRNSTQQNLNQANANQQRNGSFNISKKPSQESLSSVVQQYQQQQPQQQHNVYQSQQQSPQHQEQQQQQQQPQSQVFTTTVRSNNKLNIITYKLHNQTPLATQSRQVSLVTNESSSPGDKKPRSLSSQTEASVNKLGQKQYSPEHRASLTDSSIINQGSVRSSVSHNLVKNEDGLNKNQQSVPSTSRIDSIQPTSNPTFSTQKKLQKVPSIPKYGNYLGPKLDTTGTNKSPSTKQKSPLNKSNQSAKSNKGKNQTNKRNSKQLDTSKDNSQGFPSQDKLTPKSNRTRTPKRIENENNLPPKGSVQNQKNTFTFDLQGAPPNQVAQNTYPQQNQMSREKVNNAFGAPAADQTERKFSINASINNQEKIIPNQQQSKNSTETMNSNQLSQGKSYLSPINSPKVEGISTGIINQLSSRNNITLTLNSDAEEVKRNKKQDSQSQNLSSATITGKSSEKQYNYQDLNSAADPSIGNRIETIYLNTEHNQNSNKLNTLSVPQNNGKFDLSTSQQGEYGQTSTGRDERNLNREQFDENYSLDTIESKNFNPNAQVNRYMTSPTYQVAQIQLQNDYQAKTTSGNSYSDNKIQTYHPSEINQKMFTFESPSKMALQNDLQNRLFSTDGKVVFLEDGQNTPTKRNECLQAPSYSTSKPITTFNLSNAKYDNPLYNPSTEQKDLNQYSESQRTSGWKYQSPFESKRNSYLHDGGVSPVIPSNKFNTNSNNNNNTNTNIIGQAYSYNASEIKEQSKPLSSIIDKDESSNYLYDDPIKRSTKDFPTQSINQFQDNISPQQYGQRCDNLSIFNESISNPIFNNYSSSPNQFINQEETNKFNSQKVSVHEAPSQISNYTPLLYNQLQYSQQYQQEEKPKEIKNPDNSMTPYQHVTNFSFANQNPNSQPYNYSEYGIGGITSSHPTSYSTPYETQKQPVSSYNISSQYQPYQNTAVNNISSNDVKTEYGFQQPKLSSYSFDQQKLNNLESSTYQGFSTYRDGSSYPQSNQDLMSNYQLSYNNNLGTTTTKASQQPVSQQNQSYLTDWNSLNSKIEDQNKKLQYQYDVNTRLNAIKPFQFTSSDNTPTNVSQVPQQQQQYSSSFYQLPVSNYQAEDLKTEKQYNSFVYQPQITSLGYLPPLTPTASSNQHQTAFPASQIAFNKDIQDILDRYIPKSTPSLAQQYSLTKEQEPLSSILSAVQPQMQQPQDNEYESIKKSKQVNGNNTYNDSSVYTSGISNYYPLTTQNEQFLTQPKAYEFIKSELPSGENTGRLYSFQDNEVNNSNPQLQYQSNTPYTIQYPYTNMETAQVDSYKPLQELPSQQQQLYPQSVPYYDFTKKEEPNSLQDFDQFNMDQQYPVEEQNIEMPKQNLQQPQYINGERVFVVNVASILSSYNTEQQPYSYSFHSNSLLDVSAPPIPLNSFNTEEDAQNKQNQFYSTPSLTPRTLLNLPLLKAHLTKFTCEQVLEQIFDYFSLSLQSLTKDYFLYKMQQLIKQYIPQIVSIIMMRNEILTLFEASDINKDFYLDINELGYTLSQLCKPSEEDSPIKQLFQKIDVQKTGQVTLTDFQNFAVQKGYDIITFTNLFKQLDSSKKKYITYFDLLLKRCLIKNFI